MDKLYTLQDLMNLRKGTFYENPRIFILSDMKTREQTSEAFSPTNVFIDFEGDIIIQVDEHLLKQ